MARQEQEYVDWFEENAPEPSYQPEQSYQPEPQQQQVEQPNGGQQYYDPPEESREQMRPGDDPDTNYPGPTPNTPPSGGGGDTPSAPNATDERATRAAQAAELNRRLGLSDPGNLESFLSGRNTWAGYLADQNARATNYTGNRLLDSQGGNYNNNGTLTAQGIAALRAAGLNPDGTRIGTGVTGGTGGGGGMSFGGSQNYGALMGGGDGSSFGATPAAFGETYSTLARPENLQQPYKAPVWGETFKPPTMEDVQNEGGYALGLQEGQKALERSAASRGSILSGGTQKATARFGVDYGATKYGESTGRLFDQYRQRYGQFQDAANMGLGERSVNESAFNTDSNNNLSQYLTRFNAYQTNIGNTRNAEMDIWSRNQGLIDNSLRAAALARPF